MSNLVNSWGSPKVPKLARQQVCARLPIEIQAQIEALATLYANTGRTRTDIIVDLLQAGLSQVNQEMFRERPMEPEEAEGLSDHLGRSLLPGENMTFARDEAFTYRSLIQQRRKALEDELASDSEGGDK